MGRCFHIAIIGCRTVGCVVMYELYKLITETKIKSGTFSQTHPNGNMNVLTKDLEVDAVFKKY